MRSKFSLFGLAMALLLPACSLRLNEELTKSEIKINPLNGCLAQSATVSANYFRGESSDAELNKYWNCMDRAVSAFGEYTQGKSRGDYTGEEMADFFSKYFLKGKTFSPEMISESMFLKQALIGGSSRTVNKEELAKIAALLKTLRKVSLNLRPHMPLSAPGFKRRNLSPEEVNTALEAFLQAAKEIAGSVQAGSYSFDRMAAFFTAFKEFLYPGAENNNWVDHALTFTRAVRPVKAILVSPPADEIRDQDWVKFYDLLPRYYALYIRASHYAAAEGKFSSPQAIPNFEKIFQEFHALLEVALANQPEGELKGAEIDALLSTLAENGLLPVKTETAQSFSQTVFQKLLGDGKNYVVNRASLERLSQNVLFATEGLRAIDGVFRVEGRTKSLLPDQFLRHHPKNMLDDTAQKSKLSEEAVEAVRMIAKDVKTVFPNNSGSVFIPSRRGSVPLSLSHLSTMHLAQTLNRLAFRAYGKDELLPREQVVLAANEFFPLVEEIGLVGPETRASIPKRLFEASLFLYSSDGDPTLTTAEALELEALLLSTLNRGGVLHQELAKACTPANALTETDEKGDALIEPTCYRRTFLKNVRKNWANIPGLGEFFGQLPLEKQKSLFLALENFLKKGRTKEKFRKSDTYSFILLPYYVELLFSRFDKDRNGLFDNAEAQAAYPVFAPFLAEKCAEKGLTSDDDHRAVYAFLLGYQTLPTDMKVTWLWRRYVIGAKNFKVDRGQVIQIFEKLLSL